MQPALQVPHDIDLMGQVHHFHMFFALAVSDLWTSHISQMLSSFWRLVDFSMGGCHNVHECINILSQRTPLRQTRLQNLR